MGRRPRLSRGKSPGPPGACRIVGIPGNNIPHQHHIKCPTFAGLITAQALQSFTDLFSTEQQMDQKLK